MLSLHPCQGLESYLCTNEKKTLKNENLKMRQKKKSMTQSEFLVAMQCLDVMFLVLSSESYDQLMLAGNLLSTQ